MIHALDVLEQLRSALPRIAEILNTTQDKLKVLDFYLMPQSGSLKFQDYTCESYGLIEGLPYIQTNLSHEPNSAMLGLRVGYLGIGLRVFECRGDRNLKYVLFSFKDIAGATHNYYVLKEKEVFRIMRNVKRFAKLSDKKPITPILPPGLLEDILNNTVNFIANKKKIEKYGVKIKRGIILDGPPGNGKTLVCKYIRELCLDNNIDWDIVTASDIESAFADGKLSQLFNRAKVTFFDDIDISYLSRSAGKGNIACSILSAMDGIDNTDHVIRIFTTNERIESLDEAFTRPGRIDKKFTFDKPTSDLREKLILTWPEEILENINVKHLIDSSNGYSFAELESVRSNLVTNYLLGDKTWDLDKAINEVRGDSVICKKKKIGLF